MPMHSRLLLLGALLLAGLPAWAGSAPPPAPAGLRITALAPDRLELDWLPPTAPVAGYRLYRNDQPVRDLPGDALQATDTGLQPSTLYIYRLAALIRPEGGASETWVQSPLSRPAADWTLPPPEANAPAGSRYDVLVVGATPGGIAAAVSAARLGARVALVEPSRWIGGMMAGGLSNTDFRFKETHGGLFKEFTRQVADYYRTVYGPKSRELEVSIGGYKFEPHVARSVLTQLIARESTLSLFRQLRATGVVKQGNRVTAVTFEDLTGGPPQTLTGQVVIDATYEGDVAAFAGASFSVGRESRSDFNEQHAGELYWDMDTRKIVWGAGTGAGDHRVQAYNYRLCMTSRADNRVPVKMPEGYDRRHYLKIIGDVKSGYADFKRILGFQGLLPNDKWDINNSGAYWPSTDFVAQNYDYPTADWKRREEIIRAHRTYIQGLLYFLQNDPELPEAFRAEANRWGLARDEFVDNDNWPTQLYVREARRLHGVYWFTENDTRPREGAQRSPLQPDGVGVGDYSLDSHATQPPKPEQPNLIEGFFYGGRTEPYQIPFGVMVPKGIEGLLVPVAVSATHIGLSTIRMEPTWMALGQAAGTAAVIAIREALPVHRLPIPLVQDTTLLSHQVVIFLKDVGYDHRDFQALNYGGLIGLFPTYQADPDQRLDRGTAAGWLWHWMRVRRPKLAQPEGGAPLPPDVAADSPLAPAVAALIRLGVVTGVAASDPFRPADPVAADDAARWIARAHRVSDRSRLRVSPALRDDLEAGVLGLLRGVVDRDAAINRDALTRAQFLRMLYLAAQTGAPRR